jgi:hypothetical protein
MENHHSPALQVKPMSTFPRSEIDTTPRCWIAVACAEHALRGRDHQPSGFMQVCHGKPAPLGRLQAGDVVAYYAPAQTMGGKDRLQSFVSIGVVLAGDAYAVDMGGGFVPHRRNVRYVSAQPAAIATLLDSLACVEDRQRWGYMFRLGLFQVSRADMVCIASAMRADAAALGLDAPGDSPASDPVNRDLWAESAIKELT